jgi:hypothetical protein
MMDSARAEPKLHLPPHEAVEYEVEILLVPDIMQEWIASGRPIGHGREQLGV